MKLRTIEINSFMGIGHAKLALTDKGLVLIQGENLDDPSADSNGAGKSTLGDAIAWCFFAETARDGLSADAVVNNQAKKDCWVEACLEEDDGSFHTIKRWRKLSGAAKKNGVSISYTDCAGTVTDNTKGTDALTQPEIEKALGCTQDVFMAAVYASQEKFPDLPAMTDTKLKVAIEEASGVTTLIRAHEIARQRLKDAERDQDVWRLDHTRAERDVTDTKTRRDDLLARRDGFETTRASEVARLKVDLNASIGRARAHKLKRDGVDPVRTNKEIEQLDARIAAVETEQTVESRLFSDEREAAGRRTTMETQHQAALTQARAAGEELRRINDRVGTPCTTCGKPYAQGDLATASTIAADKVRELVTRAREIATDVDELRRVETVAKDALDAHRAKRTDIRATVEERKRLATLLQERNLAETSMNAEITAAQRIKADLERKTAETNPYIALVDTAERELKEAVAAHRESEEKGVALEKTVMVRREVVKVYGPAGVRAHILDTVTPLLNEKTADYLGVLSDGQISAIWTTLVTDPKGNLKEKFAINVEKVGDADCFAGLSGGEKRKVRLATALALQDLVASRATKPLALWIGDEIDNALDTAGIERLMQVLEAKARERGTVLVISHTDLKDWIRETTTVTRKGKVSTVSGVLEAA